MTVRSTRKFTFKKASRSDFLRSLPLREYFIDRGPVETAKKALTAALKVRGERAVQRALEQHPRLLVRNLTQGLGWVIPQKRLGSEFVTDFVIAERLSPGFYWQAIELESPDVPMFTKAGDPSRHLMHGIRQIQDWRSWLEANQAYASRPAAENGLGLVEISPRLPGLILIGRRDRTDPKTNALRRQLITDLRIDIRTYDSLLDHDKPQPLYVRFRDNSWG
jgi:hypothetical protein